MAEPSDYDLIKQFCAGKSDAFEVLVARHKQLTYNFIFRMVGSSEAADDLFQETWLKVLRAAHTYRPKAKFTTWTLQIARNATYDYFKREGIRRHASLDAPAAGEDSSVGQIIPSDDPAPAEQLMKGEVTREVQKAVNTLPQNQREALILRVYHKLPYSEISNLMNTPEGTAKYWVHEAIKSLGAHFEKEGTTNE